VSRAPASPSRPRGPLEVPALLTRASGRLVARLAELEGQLDTGDASAWPGYLATLDVLLRMTAQTAPGRQGQLLTTREMAARLGLSAKTLLKHKQRGAITPALTKGKLVRWRGTETVR
jgi:hypothetical protein